MGGVLERPAREKEIVSFSEGSLHGAVVSMQGWRPSMEVIYSSILNINRIPFLHTLQCRLTKTVVSLLFLMGMAEIILLHTGMFFRLDLR